MHCVSSYPCTSDMINLPRLEILSKLFPNAILGLSDHTSSTIIPAVSVPYGVRVVENILPQIKICQEGITNLHYCQT